MRVAELVATLSYAADLGLGQPMDHCLRQTVIALRLADLVGADRPQREATYYLGLMIGAYCHADADEQASWFGDDIEFKATGFELLDMDTQRRMEPLNKRIFGGCHLTRPITDLITGAGFEIKELDRYYEPGAPKFAGADSLGVAVSH